MHIGSMSLEYVHHIMWGLQTKHNYLFTSHTLRLTLGNLGAVMFLTLFIVVIVHPSNIHMKHCSSWYYSLKILFIVYH